MLVKRESIEYMLHDFLEIRFGIHELENARMVQYLMDRFNLAKEFTLSPAHGFVANGILVNVVSVPGELSLREFVTLNKKTRQMIHQRNAGMAQRSI